MAMVSRQFVFLSPRVTYQLAKMLGLLVERIRIAGSPFPLGTGTSGPECHRLLCLPFEAWKVGGESDNPNGLVSNVGRPWSTLLSSLGGALTTSVMLYSPTY